MAPSILRARFLSSPLRPLKPSQFSSFRPSFPRSAAPRRPASTSSQSTDSLLLGRLRVLFFSTSIAATLCVTYLYVTDTRSALHRYVVPPMLRLVFPDAEDAHHYGTLAMKLMYALGIHIRERPSGLSLTSASASEPSDLAIEVFGTTLANPVGISAGLDKDADIPDALFALGAAVVEVGGCTPKPQPGNPRPRVWRVPAVEGMVNRYGLNSRGADAMAIRLRERVRLFARGRGLTEQQVLDGEADVPPGSLLPGRLLAVQVAKNKDTDERDVEAVARDYAYCVNRLARYADVLVVNVSSPNTPGLRDLQAVEPLTRILGAVVDEAGRAAGRRSRPKVMVKVSPDEDEPAQVEGIVQAVYMSGVDGVIVGNTTKRRAGLVPQGVPTTGREQRVLMEQGGFSGPTMFGQTLELVGRYRKMLDQHSLRGAEGEAGGEPAQKVIFASGGIKDGRQALQVLNAGASLAMLYTGLVYGGSGTVTRMKDELRREITAGKA
ncbi:hypothetical protein NKR23_g8505 [Pleurostoma richardsiae]|uniref:Dihydroorotate dehydrogenase catalytic domain-containing protein n=1 Tax=Pleurostoma richardsiae TaxID=41990 RepID=A0AA38R949_9PEZI|nr:hypothetical protein NKR23_g8505 [Pleurostoma richardsiae]